MKQFSKTHLPESVEHNGETYHFNQDITADHKMSGIALDEILNDLKSKGQKAVMVNVLQSNLKGKKDLHGQPYKPSKYIFTTNKKA